MGTFGYRLLSRAVTIATLFFKEGPRNAFAIVLLNRSTHDSNVSRHFRAVGASVIWRPRTLDLPTLINTVHRREWTFLLPDRFDPRAIVDAGAFIGDTSMHFLARYPLARLVAIEPDKENFELLVANLASWSQRAECLQTALLADARSFDVQGSSTHAHIVVGEGSFRSKSLSVRQLFDHLPGDTIDLLKLDVEGAEDEILNGSPDELLLLFKHILVEFHDVAVATKTISRMSRLGFSSNSYRSVTHFELRERVH